MAMMDKQKDGAKVIKKGGLKKKVAEAKDVAAAPKETKEVPKGAESKPTPKAQKGDVKPPQAREKPTPEEIARTIWVFGCPLKVQEADLLAKFPAAEQVKLLGHKGAFSGTVILRFKTEAEAEEAAKVGSIEILGRTVRVALNGVRETPEEREQRQREERQRKVYVVDLPESVTEADVMQVFPNAEGARLFTNRQGKFCGRMVVFFRTVEETKAALAREIELNGVKVKPSPFSENPPKGAPKAAASSKPAAQPSEDDEASKKRKRGKSEVDTTPKPEMKPVPNTKPAAKPSADSDASKPAKKKFKKFKKAAK